MLRFATVLPAALSLLLLASACGEGNTGDPATTPFSEQLGVDLSAMEKRPSGLYVQDLTVGQGSVAAVGSTPSVRYTGWLADGQVVDSNLADAQPWTFKLGAGNVIRGWDEGLVGMRVGGVRRLVIPSDLGYGDKGYGPVPGKAVLVFRVELVAVTF
ncbi:FKBP-type peptidyl-prolyl cis-trans isomerase [Aggregicoccus sp. 17bor-14]|uniref:FKBP-type peptidyl-prolyl cis-trans isomerase n=1 Tax=Myxococcaceae TaxID=31 RepID=UPI00129C9132|nr:MULTISPECIES: FKBP-type peptidyl-prolyl cis-trans isomerase [Myxococcaceae]MBF5044886.1 FKBP-type peptidyl-prolyl cis-trans isomerase [Simulacricoccus sp. 17bor-14]MRI90630.1 FKBP-type peptidyl-prolyl cis-trans isomerase [Aggregicoccus sp. 17bor-14]